MIEHCCAFTGHRPKKFPWGCNEADARCIALKQALDTEIAKLVNAGYTDFFSGMAEGADTWAAQAVLTLKKENPALKLHCVLPCEGQADGWPASARERYFSILAQADEVVYVSREYREGCMLERNRYLVDHAACLLAVYNGERRGGTAMTVRYARKLGREVIILNPVQGIAAKSKSAVVFCSRIRYDKNVFHIGEALLSWLRQDFSNKVRVEHMEINEVIFNERGEILDILTGSPLKDTPEERVRQRFIRILQTNCKILRRKSYEKYVKTIFCFIHSIVAVLFAECF